VSNELDKPTGSPTTDGPPPATSENGSVTPPSPAQNDLSQTPFAEPAGDSSIVTSKEVGDLNIVDEGDVLPTGDYQMDITFDDEGLNALERIFLLSQSDFGFHRAYVARVLGDLLEDVDPCESVEYVLPLLNGYSVDEDDTVKEAFSSQLHKILWYFFSTCRLISEPGETVTVTSEGLTSVPRPEVDDEPPIPLAIDAARRLSLLSGGGPSSCGSSLTNPPPSVFDGPNPEVDTPNSMTSVSSEHTAFSPLPWVDVSTNDDPEKGPTQLVPQPELAISTFTPLLGNLMLSVNPTVGENSRDAIIAVIGRLRGVINPDKWARIDGEPDYRKTYTSQSGTHAHDLRPFGKEARGLIEAELLSGIVLGMGRLSTDLPEGCYDDESAESKSELEAYQIQLVQEADAGRAISMFLIGSLCDIYSGSEASERGFVEEVLGAVDGDATTRTEAAVALSRMAKIVPEEHVPYMVSLVCSRIVHHD
jgi:serine/threonine-protein phosphatase 4 regulatory subunit 1